jgi:hypothetical protein
MRWFWLRAALLGLLIGPAPAAVEAEAGEPSETERLFPGTVGHAVRGPGFYVWEEDARDAEEWAHELGGAAGRGDGAAPWRAIAARTAVGPSILRNEDELKLAAGIEACDGQAGISPLGLLLCLLPSLDRTCLISSCATSSHEPTRLALSRALAAPFEAVGVRAALDHMQNDPSAEVRKSARSAVVARRVLLG